MTVQLGPDGREPSLGDTDLPIPRITDTHPFLLFLKEPVCNVPNGDIKQFVTNSYLPLYLVEQLPCAVLCQFPVLRPQGFTKVLFLLRCPGRELPHITRCVDPIQTNIPLEQGEFLRLVLFRVLGIILQITVLGILYWSSSPS